MRHGFDSVAGFATALFSGSLLLLQPAVAAGEFGDTEQAYLQDLPVVLSASRLSQPVSEAPNAMTVIDRQMIVASGFRTIPELFRLVPGMYVGYAGANAPFVSLNGVTDQYSRRMQVLVDGRSVYLPPYGGVDWLDLPLLIDDIERIEVVRGPAAASHGTNSFYGVINIITREAGSAQTRSVKLNKGEMGIEDWSARLGGSGEQIDYRLSFGQRADGGDNPRVLNDYSSNRLLNLRGNYRPDSANSFELQFGLNNGSYGMGTAGRPEDAFREISTHNEFQQLGWLHNWESGDETRLTLYRIQRDYTDPYRCTDYPVCKSATPAPGFEPDRANIRRNDVEIQNTQQLGASNRAVWGGGVRQDYAEQPLVFGADHTQRQSRLFAHDEWRMNERTLLNLGAMYEDDGGGHRNTSPRLSLNHHLLPQHTLRFLMSSATRNPMMAELHMRTARQAYWNSAYVPPAADIRPERIFSRELGYVGQYGDFGVESRAYYDRVSDIIMVDAYVDGNFASRTDSFKNMVDATFKGLDVSADYRWEGGKLVLNYARQQTRCWFSSYPTQYFNPTPVAPGLTAGQYLAQAYQADYLDLCDESVPANSGSLLFSQQMFETYQFSLGYYLRSKVRVTDVSSGFPPESRMRRVDLRIASRFGKKEKAGGGEMAVVIQNAFQDNYTGYGNVAQRSNLLYGRRAYFTATINF
jgi:iron complex outermembrane receptor protein